MKKTILIILALFYIMPLFGKSLENQVISITVTSQSYDHDTPWKKLSFKKQKTSGCYMGNGLILTESHSLKNHVLIEASKFGNNQKYMAEIIVKDYLSGLALLKIKDQDFYRGLAPVILGPKQKLTGVKATIVKWDSTGSLKEYSAESYNTSIKFYEPNCPVLMHHMTTAMNDGGNGEPVFQNNMLIGIAASYDKNLKTMFVIAIDMISRLMRDMIDGNYAGQPFFWIEDYALENDANLKSYLGLKKNETGIFVSSVSAISSGYKVLKNGDVILGINNFTIDDNGTYLSPVYGKLSYHGIFLLNYSAGDVIRVKILRNKKRLSISFPLIKYNNNSLLIPEINYDSQPAYYIFGGLAFQEFTKDYLKTWGQDWIKKADKRLLFYYDRSAMKSASKSQRRLIILNRILPADCNSGYQTLKFEILESVNNKAIKDIRDLRKVILSSKETFLVFNFIGGNTIVLDRLKALKQQKTILKQYNIYSQYIP